jgi:MFS family permease
LADGLRWLFAHRLLRTMAVMLGICNLATMMGQALFVKYASDELGVTGGGYGVLLAVMSAGSILGGLAGDRVASKFGTSTTIIVSYSTFATASLAMGLWRNIPVAVAASAATSIAGTVWNVATVSLRQRIIPSELFGRVNSAYRFIGTGFIAVGSAIGGFIAKGYDYAAPFLVGGIIMTTTIVVGARSVVRHASAAGV